jgi:hypothetical protein
MKLELTLGPAEREQSYYQYLPFSVEKSWRSVAVELSYDRSSAVIDLGLLGPGGFRGWSGGARTSVEVSERWATPGYLPGPLEGEWSVLLGLYQVPDHGVSVTVTVGQGRGEPPPDEEWPPLPQDVPRLQRPPARPGYKWVAGDFHCHSEHSDGALSISRLAALARSRGLDFLAVSDHNTVSHFPHLGPASERYGLTLVPGQEVTTTEGHANCTGPVEWADFRVEPGEWMAKAEAEGGLASLNHPVLGTLSWRKPLSRPPALLELWHASWDRQNADALRLWASLGCPVPVGGSDFHRPGDVDATGAALWPGSPTTWVEVPETGDGPPSVHAVLEGLRAGSVAISESPLGPVVCRRGDEVLVTGGEGATLVVQEVAGQPVGEGRRRLVRSGREVHRAGEGTVVLLAGSKVLALSP